MSKILHVDLETYSSVDIKTCGSYKYFESLDFEILMLAYAFDNEPVQIIDLSEQEIPSWLWSDIENPAIEKHAHNATFERNALLTYGIDSPAGQWHCSAVKSAYCGLPLSLGEVSKALNLGNLGKSAEGTALIKYFCVPVKATKTNGMRTRNYPHHDPEKWQKFKDYCMQDVEAERTIGDKLSRYKIPEFERANYILDQKINDKGVLIDVILAEQAVKFNDINVGELMTKAKELSGLQNPNSAPQLKKWLEVQLGTKVTSLTKDTIKLYLEAFEKETSEAVNVKPYKEKDFAAEATRPGMYKYLQEQGFEQYMNPDNWVLKSDFAQSGYEYMGSDTKGLYNALKNKELNKIPLADKANVKEVLELRQKMAKTSIQKYVSMLGCYCEDLRVRGIHQFYGAGRTGRWAGRLVQPQNMPKNFIDYLDEARAVVRSGNYDLATLLYDQISNILSQLTRTAIIAPKGKTLAVADFSAIEARVIAWLSGELWRLKVFATHGKIYEASASKMFSVPIESVTKDSDYRAKGKVAELALGYQGAVGALKTMGGEAMGLSETEMKIIVKRWRIANPKIVALWSDLESCAIAAITHKKKVVSIHKGLAFECNDDFMTIKLPSGRRLFYYKPELKKQTVRYEGKEWDKVEISYMGVDSTTKQWTRLKTYGGKITENVVQAIARDLLADAMQRLNAADYEIIMLVHDEIVCEIPDDEKAEEVLEHICELMGESLDIYSGVPFPADGYVTPYYKKE
jgi:hypothetical protein